MVVPPSTCRIVPVVEAASGEAREAIAYATSSAVTRAPEGLPLAQCLSGGLGVVGDIEQSADPRGVGGAGGPRR